MEAVNGLCKTERLSGKRSIDSLFETGTSGFVFPFKYVYNVSEEHAIIDQSAINKESVTQLDNADEKNGTPRSAKNYSPRNIKTTSVSVSVLFSVPKRQHKRANKRNLLKRRMREAYRINKHELNSSMLHNQKTCNLSLIYTYAEALPQATIENAIKKILAAIATSR